jgi:FkbM family methyltransferase
MNWSKRWQTVRRVGICQILLARSWVLLRCDNRVHSALRLPPGSLIIDIGAYLGDFSAYARVNWDARVIAIEPIEEYATQIRKRFRDDGAVEVIPVALGSQYGKLRISLADDGSSAWTEAGESREVPIVDVADIVKDCSITLMMINAEGAEYEVLRRVIDTGQIEQIETLLIQFHKFVPDAKHRRRVIRSRLRATHRLKFNVPWVWEQWIKLDKQSAS